MAYTKQNFTDGQVLTASCLNRMEQGICDACDAAEEVTMEMVNEAISAAIGSAIGGSY